MPGNEASLELLINVQANLDALKETFVAMQQGFNKAGEAAKAFTQKTEASLDTLRRRANGFAAALTQTFGAVFTVQRLKQYAAEAVEAQRAQAGLTAALKATGQFAPELNAQLLAQAKTLQDATGVADEYVTSIQRMLLQSRVAPERIGEMTEAVLDLATSLGRDAGSIALGLGQMLEGNSEAMRGFRVEMDGALSVSERMDRILAELQRRGMTGAARSAFAGMAPEVQRLKLLMADLRKEVGRLELVLAGPILAGFTRGLQSAVQWLERLGAALPGVGGQLKNLTGGAGQGLGELAPWLALAGAVTLLLKLFGAGQLVLRDFGASVGQVAGKIGMLNTVWLGLAAFTGGWSLGKAINEFEVFGAKISDWTEKYMIIVLNFWGALKDAAVSLAALVGRTALDVLLFALEKIKPALIKFAQLLKKIGINIDVSAVEKAIQDARARLDAQVKSPAEILRERKRLVIEEFQMVDEGVRARNQSREEADAIAARTRAFAAFQQTEQQKQTLLDASSAAEAARLKLEELRNQQSYDQRLRSLEEYLARKRALVDEEQAAERKALEAELERRQSAQIDPRDPQSVKANEERIRAITERLKALDFEREAALLEIAATGAKERERIAADAAEVELALAEARNQNLLAAQLRLNQELADLRQKGATDAQLDAYRQAREAQLALEESTVRLTAAEQRYQQTLEMTKNLLAAGQLTRREATQRNLAAAEQFEKALQAKAAVLEQQIARLTPAADLVGPIAPDQTAALEQARLQLEQVKGQMAELHTAQAELARDPNNIAKGWAAGLAQIRDQVRGFGEITADLLGQLATGISNAAGEAFRAWITGAEDAGEAFQRMIAQMLLGFAVAIAQALALFALLTLLDAIFPGLGHFVAFALGNAAQVGQFANFGQLFSAIPGRAEGGPVRGPGGPTDDKVPIWASAGEWVINARAVAKYGHRFMAALNAGVLEVVHGAVRLPDLVIPRPQYQFATGGPVSARAAGNAAGGPGNAPVIVGIGDAEIERLGATAAFRDAVRAIIANNADLIAESLGRRRGFKFA